jgi:hypothetical protein
MPGEFGEGPFHNDQADDTTAVEREAQKLLNEVITESLARDAVDNLFDRDADERPTRAVLEAAEKILTGTRAYIALGNRPYGFRLATLEELEAFDNEDERDRISREMVEKMLAGVRIEKAVVTEEGKLSLLIELRTEKEPGDAEDK